MALAALTTAFSANLPARWSPLVTFLAALAIAAVVILLLTLAIAAAGYFRLRGKATVIPLGWSAIIDGGDIGPGQYPVFRITEKGTVIPPPFYVVAAGPGMVSDDRGNTVANRVWFRRGSGNTLLG